MTMLDMGFLIAQKYKHVMALLSIRKGNRKPFSLYVAHLCREIELCV